jgi:hypothetical protein
MACSSVLSPSVRARSNVRNSVAAPTLSRTPHPYTPKFSADTIKRILIYPRLPYNIQQAKNSGNYSIILGFQSSRSSLETLSLL